MKIKITIDQLYTISDSIGDVKSIEIEEGNGGNINVYPDGLKEEQIIIAENGDIL